MCSEAAYVTRLSSQDHLYIDATFRTSRTIIIMIIIIIIIIIIISTLSLLFTFLFSDALDI